MVCPWYIMDIRKLRSTHIKMRNVFLYKRYLNGFFFFIGSADVLILKADACSTILSVGG